MVRAAARRAGAPAAVATVLLVIYAATLARDVTFWDAGEFVAAASVFGIPHPPGTPLYILLLRCAVLLLGAAGVPAAIATNIVSALCTAAACAIGTALLHRATRDAPASIAAGLTAGTMATVWANATETEVYAASLALAMAAVWAAERAGRLESFRWSVAAAYLVMLVVPLHLSALLAAPAAVHLAAGTAAGAWTTSMERSAATRAGIVAAAAVAAFAMGRMTPIAAAVAAVALAVVAIASVRWPAPHDAALLRARRLPPPVLRAVLPIAAVAIAASALLVLLLRARHDPAINQGNPATFAALGELVSRQQYDVAALWPRQAPAWLQLGNLALYADWQVALSLGPTIFPTLLRTGATVGFVLLAAYGATVHRRRDRRTFTAMALLLAAGTLGAAVYLNLKAGPSYGHGILPPGAVREARERDYFFVLGWWAWGCWAGFGAVALARRFGVPPVAGLAVALLPALLNWRAIDRSRLPEAGLPRAAAEGLLRYLPPDAVLFVAGDNDTYPLWHAQQALGVRRDVTVITTPLLPAAWYRRELERRHRLLAAGPGVTPPWRGRSAIIRELTDAAGRLGRPVAMAVSMPARERAAAGASWVLRGPVYVQAAAAHAGGTPPAVTLDTTAARGWSRRLASLTGGADARPSLDGTSRYVQSLLRCPDVALAHAVGGVIAPRADSLAPHCNFR